MQPVFLSILFLFSIIACSSGTASSPDATAIESMTGLEIYAANCKMCHGNTGDLGMGDAKDLTLSVISTEEVIARITNGKGNMVPYKNVLTPKQIGTVAEYVLTLRKVE